MVRANAQDPQVWKRPLGLWGVGLRLKEQKGPWCSPHPWSQRAGDLTWAPSRLPGLKWAGQSSSAPLPLLLDGPSCLPLMISLASLLCPPGPTQSGGALEGRGSAWELSRLPEPEWAGQSPSAPFPLFLESPSRLPLLISLASEVPILSGLHFSSPLCPPTSYWFTLEFLPSPWASESPTSSQRAP